MYDILRILRNAQALTQENVANALHIGKSTYAKIEQGTNSLSIQYIEPLAQILGVNSRDLFELYISPNNTLADNRPLKIDFNISNKIDFGTVESLDYITIPSSGPKYLQFKVKKEDAKSFIDKINYDYSKVNSGLKEISPDCANAIYNIHELDEDDDGIEYEVFTAYLLDTVTVNNTELPPEIAWSIIEDLEVDSFHVICSIDLEDRHFGDVFRLRLDQLEFESNCDIFDLLDCIPDVKQFDINTLPDRFFTKIIFETESIRSIDQLIEIAKDCDYTLDETNARSLLKILL